MEVQDTIVKNKPKKRRGRKKSSPIQFNSSSPSLTEEDENGNKEPSKGGNIEKGDSIRGITSKHKMGENSKSDDKIVIHKDVWRVLEGKISFEEYMGYKHSKGDGPDISESSSSESTTVDVDGSSNKDDETPSSDAATVNDFLSKCSWCGITYTSQAHMDRHVDLCREKSAKVKENKDVNVESDTEEDSESKPSDTDGSLSDEAETEEGGKDKGKKVEMLTYECELCGFRTGPSKWNEYNKAKIISHYRRHTNRSILQCENCSYVGWQGRAYIDHVMSHFTEEKPLGCRVCGFRTGRRSDLRSHYTKHRAQTRGWDCDKCPYKTRAAISLRRHYMRSHLSGRHFTCPSCPFRSYLRSGMVHHLGRHAAKGPRFPCSLCPFSASDPHEVKDHVATNHVREIVKIHRIRLKGRTVVRLLVKGPDNNLILH